ncbi:hypothetical protein COCOBI_17-2780 [Coccomyxa sp. Obi]|nr:hypothetical protein COCOBI_17-2780 [Coccomyxa sp. Obi]
MRHPAVETAVVNCDGKYDPGIFQKVWRLQPSFQREVVEALKVLMTYKRPTVAFHVRGGDKLEEDRDFGRTTTAPVDLINTYLDNFPGLKAKTCLLFGDDQRRVTQVEQMVKRHISCKVVHYGVRNNQAKGHDQEAFNIQPNEDKCDATKKLITDLELMAAADYFVGSGTSILPTIVGTLRQVLYRKPQVTQADVNYLDTGVRIRRYWGLGGFHNVTVDTAEAIQGSNWQSSDREMSKQSWYYLRH